MSNENLSFSSVILAGGFGTRLEDYGETTPKGLIPLGDKQTLLGKVAENLSSSDHIGEIYMVTNGKFNDAYSKWRDERGYNIKIFNNGITVPEKKNGALKDLYLSVSHFNLNRSDLLVCPSDTYYDFSFDDFINYCMDHRDKFITIFRKMPIEEIKNRLGCAVLDGDKVVSFEEKPEEPKSPYAVIPFYYYPKSHLKYLENYIREGNNPDAPSNIIPWLLKKGIEVSAYVVEGNTLDVGTIADVEKLKELK